MASFLSWLPCCSAQADKDEVDERTALLNHDILPEAPVEQPAPGRSTEEQQARQDYLRAIIDAACARFVSVTSTNPFVNAHDSRSSPASPNSSRSPSPSRSRSSSPSPSPSPSPSQARRSSQAHRNGTSQSRSRRASNWRPPMDHNSDNSHSSSTRRGGGPFREESSDEDGKRVMRLEASFGLGARTRGATRPPSAHSLKTLPRSFARGQDGSIRGSPLARGGTDEQDDEQHGKGHNDDEDDDEDARFDTYRTAKESNDERGDLDNSRPSTNRSGTGSARLPVRDVFTAEDGHEAELQKAIKELEASMKTFKLQPVGPIIADIHG